MKRQGEENMYILLFSKKMHPFSCRFMYTHMYLYLDKIER